MRDFAYQSVEDKASELSIANGGGARYLCGGTNRVDLMRQNIEAPQAVVDVSRLPGEIVELPGGGLRIGAAARNSTLAAHPVVRTRYPVLSRALLAGASAQIR